MLLKELTEVYEKVWGTTKKQEEIALGSDYTFAIRDMAGDLAPIAKAFCGLTDRFVGNS